MWLPKRPNIGHVKGRTQAKHGLLYGQTQPHATPMSPILMSPKMAPTGPLLKPFVPIKRPNMGRHGPKNAPTVLQNALLAEAVPINSGQHKPNNYTVVHVNWQSETTSKNAEKSCTRKDPKMEIIIFYWYIIHLLTYWATGFRVQAHSLGEAGIVLDCVQSTVWFVGYLHHMYMSVWDLVQYSPCHNGGIKPEAKYL